jgi:methylmalonyl-CoA/ethylmalonyl-CoA epimerase
VISTASSPRKLKLVGPTEGGRRLHHIGFVVSSIAEAAEGFVSSMGLYWDCQITLDEVQTVSVAFFCSPHLHEPMIELVEPAGRESRVAAFLSKGGGLHHVCYEVDSLTAHLKHVTDAGAILVMPPCPAAAFGGREIAWICTPERLLVEYLQR